MIILFFGKNLTQITLFPSHFLLVLCIIKVVCFDTTGKSETERQVLANKEKEKGNEAFQSGNYMEALAYYCRSIEMNPRATAVYNNRALAGMLKELEDLSVK